MDALNFLLETTENLNDGTAKMNEGLYLDMMNKLKDLHKAVSQPSQTQIVRPVQPQEPPRPNLIAQMPLARQMADILDVPFQRMLNEWFASVWFDEQMKVEFLEFLTLITNWKACGYMEEVKTHIATHPRLNEALIRFARNSNDHHTIPWKDLVFRDKFLGIRGVAKARLGQIKRLEHHRKNQINAGVRILSERKRNETMSDADWEDYRVSAVLDNLGSSFKGKWKHFRRVFKRRTDDEMAKLHELELTFDYCVPNKKMTVWTDRIQLGRTSLVQSTALLGLTLAFHEGKTDKLFSLIRTVFGDTVEDDSPHMIVSGITGNTKAEMREYRGGWEEAFRIRYTQELNVGGKKK
jgi:hypothetical protein